MSVKNSSYHVERNELFALCEATLVLLSPVLGHGLVVLGSLSVALLLVFRLPIVANFGPPGDIRRYAHLPLKISRKRKKCSSWILDLKP